jgi:hypothetical protein
MGEEKKIADIKKEPKQIKYYADIRQDMKQGDILLYKGRGIISRGIKFFTGSEYSHAGIAIKWNERWMVMEANRRGVVVNPFQRSVNRYPGSVEWWSSIKEINDEDRRKMIIYAQKELGKRFAFFLLFWFAFVISLAMPLDKRDRFRREKRLYCSLYVAQIYHSIGIDLKKNLSDRFTSPRDIANSPKLAFRGILRSIKKREVLYPNPVVAIPNV